MIWRQGFVAFHAPVSAIELEALRALTCGQLLGDVLAPFGDDAAAAFTALRSWFTEGMVSAVAS